MIYGYARVSTIEQDTQLQLDALKKAGAEHIYSEKTSSIGKRPELQNLLRNIKKDDVLMVYKLDRLARSLKDLLHILELLESKGAKFKSLTEPVQTDNYLGKFMLQILGAVAELERNLIRERSIAGQKAAVARGAIVGRPCTVSDDDLHDIADMYAMGSTQTEIARRYNASTSAVKRYFQRHRRVIYARKNQAFNGNVASSSG